MTSVNNPQGPVVSGQQDFRSRAWNGVSFEAESRQPLRSESTRTKTIVAVAVAVAFVAVLAVAFSGALPVAAGLLLAVKVAAAVGVGGSVGYALCINLFGKHQPRKEVVKEVVIDLTRQDPGPEDDYLALMGKNLRPDGPPVTRPSTQAQPSKEVTTSEFKCRESHAARRKANQQAARVEAARKEQEALLEPARKEAARIQQIRDLNASCAQDRKAAAENRMMRDVKELHAVMAQALPAGHDAFRENVRVQKRDALDEVRIVAKIRAQAAKDAQIQAQIQQARHGKASPPKGGMSQAQRAAMKAALVGS